MKVEVDSPFELMQLNLDENHLETKKNYPDYVADQKS
jgi:hypothetical protein